ncbi:MAG: serine acetyltransferase [Nitrospirota bacterium]
MFENIRADIRRKRTAYVVRPEDQTFFRKYVKVNLQLGTIAVGVYRFGRWSKSIRIPVLRQLMFFIYSLLNMAVMLGAGINLHVYSTIGKGLVIHNFSCIFVLTERMGENCTVNQGVTIGNIRGKKHPPIVGDNVYFGAGCKVLGEIKIGNHVVIAANSLVVTDVPDNCTVAGVPARIISRDAASPYLQYAE